MFFVVKIMSLQQSSLTRRDTRGYQNIYTKILGNILSLA